MARLGSGRWELGPKNSHGSQELAQKQLLNKCRVAHCYIGRHAQRAGAPTGACNMLAIYRYTQYWNWYMTGVRPLL